MTSQQNLVIVLLLGLFAASSAAPGLIARRPLPWWNPEFSKPSFATGQKVSAWAHQLIKGGNPEELGSYFEGDIVLVEQPPLTRNGIDYAQYRWAGAVVPYEFAPNISATHRNNVNQAMSSIASSTCVKFVVRTTQVDYVSIENAKSGCWSYVGKIGGKQVLNLQDPGCTSVGTTIHELMHALGFFHEHTRDDRDQHVSIKFENVQPGREHNFDIWTGRKATYGVPYDYGSIMHYSATSFSSNGQPTIVPLVTGAKIGQRSAMSTHDITLINSMYSCPTGK